MVGNVPSLSHRPMRHVHPVLTSTLIEPGTALSLTYNPCFRIGVIARFSVSPILRESHQ